MTVYHSVKYNFLMVKLKIPTQEGHLNASLVLVSVRRGERTYDDTMLGISIPPMRRALKWDAAVLRPQWREIFEGLISSTWTTVTVSVKNDA